MSYEVAMSVRGQWVVVPSAEYESRPRVFFDRKEAETEAAKRNRARTAEIATETLDLMFGVDPDDSTLK